MTAPDLVVELSKHDIRVTARQENRYRMNDGGPDDRALSDGLTPLAPRSRFGAGHTVITSGAAARRRS